MHSLTHYAKGILDLIIQLLFPSRFSCSFSLPY